MPQKRPLKEELGVPSQEPARVAPSLVQENPKRDPDIYYTGVENNSEFEAVIFIGLFFEANYNLPPDFVYHR